jgi:uncharacterized membrane protein YdjX (TVP38/TMEM64 family)
MAQDEMTGAENDRRTDSRGRAARWVLAALVVAAVAALFAFRLDRYLSWDYLHDHVDQLHAEVAGRPLAAALIAFAVYVAVTALSIPLATALTLMIGVLFGRLVGIAIVSLAATSGASLAFLASRYLFRDSVERRFAARLAPIDRGVERDGVFYLFALRLTPIVPFFLINLAMGLTRMPLRTFALVSWLGMLPATCLYVNAGAELGQIQRPEDVLSPTVLVSLALLGVLPLAGRLLARRLQR